MGCGRVGSSLALSLEAQGHDVAVIDQEEAAFRRLGSAFEGRRVTGVGFDRDTLTEAGVSDAYAFAAVSSGDNSNILAARVARETFGVEHVVARIYDPGRAEVYQRLGIPTVATVKWTSDQMLRRLLPQGHVPELVDPAGNVVIRRSILRSSTFTLTRPSCGTRFSAMSIALMIFTRETTPETMRFGTRAAYLTRLGSAMLPAAETVFQEGDLLHLATLAADLPTVERTLDAPPAPGDH